MRTQNFLLTDRHRAGNRKTGPIPISLNPKATCPPSCPLRRNGCYAEYGPLGWHWDRL